MVAGAAVGACAVIAGILALTVGGAPSSPSADGRSARTASQPTVPVASRGTIPTPRPVPAPTTPGERVAAALLSPAQVGLPTAGLTAYSQNSGQSTAARMPFTPPKAWQACATILLSAQSAGSTATASTTVTSHDSTLVESIAAYPSDAAARLLGALPAALAGCAPQTPPGFSQYPQTIKVTTKAGPSLGNGTLLIDGTITTIAHPTTYSTILISRYGDRVIWLQTTSPTRSANDHYNLDALTEKIAAGLDGSSRG